MQHGGRRNALLGLHIVSHGNALEEPIVLQKGMILRKIQLVHDLNRLGFGLEALEGHGEMLGLDLLRTGQTP